MENIKSEISFKNIDKTDLQSKGISESKESQFCRVEVFKNKSTNNFNKKEKKDRKVSYNEPTQSQRRIMDRHN